MVDYKEEMDKLKGNQKNKRKPPPVKDCSYTGCPLKASILINGRYTCCFHYGTDFHNEVTIAIKSNKTFLQNYNSMVKWSVSQWQKNKDYLADHKLVPMLEADTPSGYLVKYFQFISNKINNEASINIEDKK